MTKKEREYITRLVNDNNNLIKDVYSGTRLEFMSKAQKEGFIQGISACLECFADMVNMQVAQVDLNNL